MHRTVPMPDMEEVDLYLRKSKRIRTEDPRDLLSVQTQEELGRAWAAKNGKRVREVWVDNLSAWSDVKLPEFDKAVAAVLAGDVPILWCAFLDRFTRKGADEIVPILGKARVIFDYEGLDSSIERDRRWIIDRAEQAREFSQRLSFNLSATKATQRNAGSGSAGCPTALSSTERTRGSSRTARTHGATWSTSSSPPDDPYVLLSDVLPTTWQAVEYAEVPRGGSVAVLGLGPIGDMCTRIAAHRGAGTVIGVDLVRRGGPGRC
ncbi:hypothetical protein GCM10010505_19120 [Kitasatospora aburaviensis]